MKRLFILLLSVIALNVSAQIAEQKDTLRIITTDGQTKNYLFDRISNIDFASSAPLLSVTLYDGTTDVYNLGNVQSLRFYNRWSNPYSLLKAQRTGAYEGLYNATTNPVALLYLISCLASDEMLGGGGPNDGLFHSLDLLSSDYIDSEGIWNVYYDAIENINNAIAQLNYLPLEVTIANRYHAHGEALFLRAYYYTQLASIFGTVPVITDNNSWKEKMTVTTPEDVWGRIFLDLRDAIKYLNGYSPTLNSDDSRVGKYAAEALLARSFLFYTGFYLGIHDISKSDVSVPLPDGTTLTKADVVAYINDCVNNSGFSLVPDYRNLWPYTNRYTVNDYDYTYGKGLKWVEDDGQVNPEVLFKIKYNKKGSWLSCPGYANLCALYMGMRGGKGVFPFGKGWGAGPVSSAFYNEWSQKEPNDIRRDASIQDINQLNQYPYGGWWGDMVQETRLQEKKNSAIMGKGDYDYYDTFEYAMYGSDGWGDYGNYDSQFGSIHPLNIIRYADVLLMQSELTGTVDGINKVRTRAGLPKLTSYSLAALQQERRWELAFEGVRWNDMRRWGDDYCKAALDKQMSIRIYNSGQETTNPNGISEYDKNKKSYSQRYAENHGFLTVPEGHDVVGGEVIAAMQGEWTYKQDDVLFDCIVIDGTTISRYDGNNNLISTGTITITPTNNYDKRICSVTITNGSMLPVSKKTADSDGTMQYDLITLEDNTIDLKCNKGSLSLRPTLYDERKLREVSGVKWSWATYTSKNYSTNTDIPIGAYGYTTFNTVEPYSGGIPIIYSNHIQSVMPKDIKSYFANDGISINNNEADPFAYMTISLKDRSIKKYKSDGTLISNKLFTATTDGYGIHFLTENDATLLPYLYNGKGKKENVFVVCAGINEFGGVYSPGLILRSNSEISSDATTYWMFSRRGMTDEEFNTNISVVQQDKDGNPNSKGHYLKVTLDVPYEYIITCEDLDGTQYVLKDGVYEIKIKKGETLTKTFKFTLKNPNGIDAVTTRSFTMINDDPLSEEIKLIVGENGLKNWTWDTEFYGGAVWGNMGYMTSNGDQFTSSIWWGCTPEGLTEYLKFSDTGVATGEESSSAYMTFYDDGTIKSYDAYDNVIRSGTFDLTDWENGSYHLPKGQQWAQAYLHTTAGSILFPFMSNGGGFKPTQFEVMRLDDTHIQLVYAAPGTGSWSEATWWAFKAK